MFANIALYHLNVASVAHHLTYIMIIKKEGWLNAKKNEIFPPEQLKKLRYKNGSILVLQSNGILDGDLQKCQISCVTH